MRINLLACIVILALCGCSKESTERRAREAAEKIMGSIRDVEAEALAQKVTPEQVSNAQKALSAANEYQGEVNGKLDSVTVNAIEAFQRAHGLPGNGLLDEKTQRLLNEQLAKK